MVIYVCLYDLHSFDVLECSNTVLNQQQRLETVLPFRIKVETAMWDCIHVYIWYCNMHAYIKVRNVRKAQAIHLPLLSLLLFIYFDSYTIRSARMQFETCSTPMFQWIWFEWKLCSKSWIFNASFSQTNTHTHTHTQGLPNSFNLIYASFHLQYNWCTNIVANFMRNYLERLLLNNRLIL